jgi:hypothetical protein
MNIKNLLLFFIVLSFTFNLKADRTKENRTVNDNSFFSQQRYNIIQTPSFNFLGIKVPSFIFTNYDLFIFIFFYIYSFFLTIYNINLEIEKNNLEFYMREKEATPLFEFKENLNMNRNYLLREFKNILLKIQSSISGIVITCQSFIDNLLMKANMPPSTEPINVTIQLLFNDPVKAIQPFINIININIQSLNNTIQLLVSIFNTVNRNIQLVSIQFNQFLILVNNLLSEMSSILQDNILIVDTIKNIIVLPLYPLLILGNGLFNLHDTFNFLIHNDFINLIYKLTFGDSIPKNYQSALYLFLVLLGFLPIFSSFIALPELSFLFQESIGMTTLTLEGIQIVNKFFQLVNENILLSLSINFFNKLKVVSEPFLNLLPESFKNSLNEIIARLFFSVDTKLLKEINLSEEVIKNTFLKKVMNQEYFSIFRNNIILFLVSPPTWLAASGNIFKLIPLSFLTLPELTKYIVSSIPVIKDLTSMIQNNDNFSFLIDKTSTLVKDLTSMIQNNDNFSFLIDKTSTLVKNGISSFLSIFISENNSKLMNDILNIGNIINDNLSKIPNLNKIYLLLKEYAPLFFILSSPNFTFTEMGIIYNLINILINSVKDEISNKDHVLRDFITDLSFNFSNYSTDISIDGIIKYNHLRNFIDNILSDFSYNLNEFFIDRRIQINNIISSFLVI